MLSHGKLKNGGGTAAAAENRRLPPIFFLPFLAELDNSESFETNFFFLKKIPLVFAIECQIRREMAKKFRRQTAIFGGSGGTAAVSSVFRVDQFNSENILKN